MKKFLLAAAAVATFGLASQAQAATPLTFHLTDDHCSGTCGLAAGASYGTLTVSGSGTTQIDFSLDLTSGIFFNSNGAGLDTFSWDLLNNPKIDLSGLSAGFTAVDPQTAGSNHEDGFGSFDYVVNATSNTLTHLQFSVVGSGTNAGAVLTLDHNTADSQSIFAAVDVIGSNGNTGVVGATTFTGGVPEPATWGMMLVGFGGLGAMMRRRRAMATVATA